MKQSVLFAKHTFGFSFIALFFVFTAAIPNHDFHSSLTNIEQVNGRYEITLRLFSDDLEKAVSAFAKKKVNLEELESEGLLQNYLTRNLKIQSIGSSRINWEWIGYEAGPEATKIYLEYKAKDNASLTVRSTLLTEMYDDQQNIVTLNRNGTKQSQLLDKEKTSYTFELKND